MSINTTANRSLTDIFKIHQDPDSGKVYVSAAGQLTRLSVTKSVWATKVEGEENTMNLALSHIQSFSTPEAASHPIVSLDILRERAKEQYDWFNIVPKAISAMREELTRIKTNLDTVTFQKTNNQSFMWKTFDDMIQQADKWAKELYKTGFSIDEDVRKSWDITPEFLDLPSTTRLTQAAEEEQNNLIPKTIGDICRKLIALRRAQSLFEAHSRLDDERIQLMELSSSQGTDAFQRSIRDLKEDLKSNSRRSANAKGGIPPLETNLSHLAKHVGVLETGVTWISNYPEHWAKACGSCDTVDQMRTQFARFEQAHPELLDPSLSNEATQTSPVDSAEDNATTVSKKKKKKSSKRKKNRNANSHANTPTASSSDPHPSGNTVMSPTEIAKETTLQGGVNESQADPIETTHHDDPAATDVEDHTAGVHDSEFEVNVSTTTAEGSPDNVRTFDDAKEEHGTSSDSDAKALELLIEASSNFRPWRDERDESDYSSDEPMRPRQAGRRESTGQFHCLP